jgi:micrococcal nuclease
MHARLILVILLLLAPMAGADLLTGTVTAVTAGDLLKLEADGETKEIRLFGVDCPEQGQPFSEEALEFTRKRVLDKEIEAEILCVDNHEIAVARVTLPDGDDLGNALLLSGLAWWDSENVPEDRKLKGHNAKAIAAAAGLWSDADALAPWDYRKSEDLPPVIYSLKKEEVLPVIAQEEAEEEPKVLSAKGEETYKCGFSVDASQIKFDQDINPTDLMMKHTPRIANDPSGKPIGVAVPNISQIPYAGQFGFRDGDIISSVNGQRINDLSQIMGMVNQFRGQKQLNVEVIRNGAPTNINIKLP